MKTKRVTVSSAADMRATEPAIKFGHSWRERGADKCQLLTILMVEARSGTLRRIVISYLKMRFTIGQIRNEHKFIFWNLLWLNMKNFTDIRGAKLLVAKIVDS